MISNYKISNFKLHDHTNISFKGLTILTGMNGMGKSSVIQSLVLLRQSFMSDDLDEGLNLKGDLCDGGTAMELSCQSSNSNNLDINLEFTDQAPLAFSFTFPKDPMETFLPNAVPTSITKKTLSKYSLFNENFQYLSAFRLGPQKIYGRDTSLVDKKRQISKVAGQCEYTVNFLSRYGDEEIPVRELAVADGSEGWGYKLRDQVKLWLRLISPNIDFRIENVSEDFRLSYLFDRKDNVKTMSISALHTGFGITYVLPILVAILSARKGALIIIENPEAHIHPEGQANMMRLMSMAVKNGIQIVVETHSDHIINGALVAVKQKELDKDMLSISFFDRDEHLHVAQLHQLSINDDGSIDNPPKGFFDQIDKDLEILTGF